MKRRWRAALFGALAIIVVFAVTCYVFYLKRQTAALLAARKTPEAVARYDRIRDALKPSPSPTPSTAANADWPPRLPEGDPAGAELLAPLKQAEALYTRVHEEIKVKGEWDALYDDLFSRPVSTWSETDWERLNAFLAEHADLLAEIRAMAAGSGPLYPLDLSQGWATLLPHLAPTRDLARLLQAEAIALGRAGDFDGAAADIRAGLQLAARIQGEPLIISQLVAIAIGSSIQEGATAAYPEGRIPTELASEMARYFHTNPFGESIAAGIQAEEGISLDVFARIMNSSWEEGRRDFVDVYFESSADRSDRWTGYLYTSPLARPWQNLDMQSYARIMDEFESTLGLPYYEARDYLEGIEQEVDSLPATRVLTRSMLPSLFSIHTALAQAEARREIFLIGTALESYANEHGDYPPSLDAVQGQTNGASVIDPFTGLPFRYSTTGSGFELYSVGRDLADDGGRHDFDDGDIVWRGEEAPKTTELKVGKHGTVPNA